MKDKQLCATIGRVLENVENRNKLSESETKFLTGMHEGYQRQLRHNVNVVTPRQKNFALRIFEKHGFNEE